jgi:hypothetical protein
MNHETIGILALPTLIFIALFAIVFTINFSKKRSENKSYAKIAGRSLIIGILLAPICFIFFMLFIMGLAGSLR